MMLQSRGGPDELCDAMITRVQQLKVREQRKADNGGGDFAFIEKLFKGRQEGADKKGPASSSSSS